MVRTTLLVLLLAFPVFAQDATTAGFAAAGCGPNEVHFDVQTDKKNHPTAQPAAGKALVRLAHSPRSAVPALLRPISRSAGYQDLGQPCWADTTPRTINRATVVA